MTSKPTYKEPSGDARLFEQMFMALLPTYPYPQGDPAALQEWAENLRMASIAAAVTLMEQLGEEGVFMAHLMS